MGLIKIKKGVILEYDKTFNELESVNNFELFKAFYNSIFKDLIFDIDKDKILVISFTTNNFFSKLISINNEEILSQINNKNYFFEINTNILSDNNKEKIIINIKKYLENSLNYLNMNEVQKMFKEINDKLDKREKEFKIQELELNEMKKNIKKYWKIIKKILKKNCEN